MSLNSVKPYVRLKKMESSLLIDVDARRLRSSDQMLPITLKTHSAEVLETGMERTYWTILRRLGASWLVKNELNLACASLQWTEDVSQCFDLVVECIGRRLCLPWCKHPQVYNFVKRRRLFSITQGQTLEWMIRRMVEREPLLYVSYRLLVHFRALVVNLWTCCAI